MAKTKDKPAIRIARFEVRGVDPDTKRRWMALADATRRVLNDLRAMWLAAHYEAGDHLAVRAWREADMAWVKTPKPDRQPRKRVPCPVACWPKRDGVDLCERLRKRLMDVHPAMHSRCVTLAVQKERKTMAQVKGSHSAYPQWMLALCGDGEFRQNRGPQPIPFDRGNARLVAPHGAQGWQVELRVDRLPREGQPATSHLDRVGLYTGGRRLRGLRTVLERIDSGAYCWKGSSLQFREGKWYVLLSYTLPKPDRPALDCGKVARLVPAKDRPVKLWLGDWPHYLRRHGRDVAHVRTALLVQRWCRQSAYKDAGSAQKGHGRQKWQRKIGKLSRRWRDFVKTYNEQLARDVVTACVDRGVGTLVYHKPAGAFAKRPFLATAGKVGGREDASAWDWYQLKTLLARRCEELGIAFITRDVQATSPRRKSNGRGVGAKG